MRSTGLFLIGLAACSSPAPATIDACFCAADGGVRTDAQRPDGSITPLDGSRSDLDAAASPDGGAGAVTRGVYGNVWSGDSLQNWTVGGEYGQRWSYRFRAERAGALEHVRIFWVTNRGGVGYSSGTGGTIRVSLCVDDGSALHAPDCATPLATDEHTFALVDGEIVDEAERGEITFHAHPLDATLEAEQLYHVVFENLDSAPEVNFIGLDGITEASTMRVPGRPSALDWGLLVDDGDGWIDWSNDTGDRIDTPVMSIVMADGEAYGCGYMEVWSGEPQGRAVEGSAGVREIFTPSRDVEIEAVHVRIRRARPGGTLAIRLVDDTDAEVGVAHIPASEISEDDQAWVSATFATSHVLSSGRTYRAELAAEDGGAFVANTIRDGQTWGFESGSVFADGWAEFDRDDGLGWLGWYGWSEEGDPAYRDGDLQLYFDTVSLTPSP